MAVRANASAVKTRIARLRAGLFSAAEEGTRKTAEETIDRVQDAAIIRVGAEAQRQVGFDMVQFLDNVEGVTRIAPGIYAILDTEKMGTADDFEKIARVRDLWHFGRGQGAKFERLILSSAGWTFLVGGARKAIWGTKTPQWYLLENGTSTGDGTPVPPGNFIRSVASNEAGILASWKANIFAALRRKGII